MVTGTGAAIILLGLWYFFTDGRRLMPALVFFASFSATAVINFSNYGMAPAVVFLLLLIGWKVLSGDMLRRIDISRDHMVLLGLLAAFGLLAIFSLLLNQADHVVLPIQVTQTAYVLFGVCITVLLSLDMARPERMEAAVTALRVAAVFISLWGILQAVCYYGGMPYPAFLFNNSTSHFADMFDQRAGDGIMRIASVATEPSFMAISLMMFGSFGATVLAIEPRLRQRNWVVAVVLCLLVVLASTSTTGYFGLAVLAVLLGLRRPGLLVIAGGAVALLLAIVIVSLPQFGHALFAFTLGKASTGSYVDRTATVWESLRLIMQRPWLGGGWGSNYSFSILTIVPANSGLFGTAAFVLAYGGAILASRAARRSAHPVRQWRHIAYAQGAEAAMTVLFGQSVVAGFHFVVADFWCLWALCIGIGSCLVCGRRLAVPTVRRGALAGARQEQSAIA